MHFTRSNTVPRSRALQLQKQAVSRCTLPSPPDYIARQAYFLNGHQTVACGHEPDTQRSKLYRAERILGRGVELPTVVAMQTYLDTILTDPWFVDRFKDWTITVDRGGHGRKRACGIPSQRVIKMPEWSRCERLVIHEMCHVIVPAVHAWHGRLYACIYAELVGRYMGCDFKEMLVASFRKHNVKFTPYRELQI